MCVPYTFQFGYFGWVSSVQKKREEKMSNDSLKLNHNKIYNRNKRTMLLL